MRKNVFCTTWDKRWFMFFIFVANSILISPLLDIVTNTRSLDSARTEMGFATQITDMRFLPLLEACQKYGCPFLQAIGGRNYGNWQGVQGHKFSYHGKIPRTHLAVKVVPNTTNFVRFSAPPKHIWTWRSPIWTIRATNQTMDISCFVAAWRFGVATFSILLLHCCRTYASLTTFRPSSLSSRHVAGCRTYLVKPIVWVLYFSVSRERGSGRQFFKIYVGILINLHELPWCNIRSWNVPYINFPSILLPLVVPIGRFHPIGGVVRGSFLRLVVYTPKCTWAVSRVPRGAHWCILWL